ncbi:unnamed protein product [Gongylonema pulchrum]|uniref:KCNQ_channel domain-containing protein n=1 Tax=Gongylonema pulchrum TaxID=637853 RepID=A0A183EA07_9BILA|nr:unnamed protein product [Gongylonema pulchrum]
MAASEARTRIPISLQRSRFAFAPPASSRIDKTNEHCKDRPQECSEATRRISFDAAKKEPNLSQPDSWMDGPIKWRKLDELQEQVNRSIALLQHWKFAKKQASKHQEIEEETHEKQHVNGDSRMDGPINCKILRSLEVQVNQYSESVQRLYRRMKTTGLKKHDRGQLRSDSY